MAQLCFNQDTNEILLFQSWEDSEAHDDYLNWRAESGIFDEIADLVAAEPVHSSFQQFDSASQG